MCRKQAPPHLFDQFSLNALTIRFVVDIPCSMFSFVCVNFLMYGFFFLCHFHTIFLQETNNNTKEQFIFETKSSKAVLVDLYGLLLTHLMESFEVLEKKVLSN